MKKLKLLIAACLVAAGAFAQCAAHFTSVVNPANNGSVAFTSTSTGTGMYTNYYYDFGDGTSSNWSANVSHTFLSGTYTVCLTLSDSVGSCTSVFCDSVVVINNTLPSCNAYFIASDSLGNTFQINNYSSGTGLTYFWDLGDGNTSTSSASMFQHTYASSGIYTICLTVTNAGATCTNTYCDTIVLSSCTASYASIADSAGNGVTFSAVTSGSPTTYLWNFGDGNTSTQINPYHVYATSGYYSACLTVSSTVDTTCSAYYCSNILAGTFCNASFSIVQDSMNLYNYTIYNNAFSSGSITSWLWNWGDSTTSTTQYPTHTYMWSIPYQICLTITSSNGCTATYCDSIWAGHSVNQTATVTVLPPLSVGIAEHKVTEQALGNYPNPFTGSTVISYSLNQNTALELSVSDLLGNKVAVIESGNKVTGSYKTIFDASDISAGIYLLQLKTDTKLITKKLVISK